jgi:hypothetical protein
MQELTIICILAGAAGYLVFHYYRKRKAGRGCKACELYKAATSARIEKR